MTDTATRLCHVLVADDEPHIGRIIKMKLEQGPFKVSLAYDGEEALDLINSEESVDLALLDLMMPVMNGWDFHARLKANPRLAHVPVLLLSAYVHNETHTGPKDVEVALQKPIRIEEFLGWVRRLARRLNR